MNSKVGPKRERTSRQRNIYTHKPKQVYLMADFINRNPQSARAERNLLSAPSSPIAFVKSLFFFCAHICLCVCISLWMAFYIFHFRRASRNCCCVYALFLPLSLFLILLLWAECVKKIPKKRERRNTPIHHSCITTSYEGAPSTLLCTYNERRTHVTVL